MNRTPLVLPDGLRARPLQLTDARAVFELMAVCERADVGEVTIEEEDIVGDWQRPSFDVSTQAIGVFDGDRLVGYGEYGGGDRSDAAVHPAYRGRGLGTALAAWIRRTAVAHGATIVGMPVPAGSPSEALLRALGYFQRWESWVLALPEGVEVTKQPLPEGFSLRESAGEADHVAAWELVEDAFLEFSDRPRDPFDDWAATTVRRPGFQPWNLRLVHDPAGALAGVAVVFRSDDCGYVDKLAVRRDVRGLGLARALLADAFAAARAQGATRMELSTDSRTGALGLYERVGMVVTSRWFHLAADLQS